MNLIQAQSLLLRDRMDWRKPHLRWVADAFYRQFVPAHLKKTTK